MGFQQDILNFKEVINKEVILFLHIYLYKCLKSFFFKFETVSQFVDLKQVTLR